MSRRGSSGPWFVQYAFVMSRVNPVVIGEAEWLTTTDLTRPFRFIFFTASTRKLRLFARAAVDEIRHLITNPAVFDAIDAAEACVEGGITKAEFLKVRAKVDWTCGGHPWYDRPHELYAADHAASLGRVTAGKAAWEAFKLCDRYHGGGWNDPIQASFLRDIFGNPFRPVAFAPEWRTSTTIALAESMYTSRDFGAMPVLADALEEAACDHPDVQAHCREDGPHVRGCWVVDLILGKS